MIKICLPTLFLVLPISSDFYSFKGSPIKMINQEKWKNIAKGEDPFIWMINFYCETPKDKCAKSYELKDDYTDAANILYGIVTPAAYKVKADFPAFVRIPSVMIYVPNSTEPYVFEMENYPEQIKRPSFRLVNFIQDLVINHIHSDQVRHITSSWTLNQIRVDEMRKIADNEISNQCTFVLLYDDYQKEAAKVQLLAAVATVIYKVHGLEESNINFGVANFWEVKDAFLSWGSNIVAPKFAFFGPRNSPTNKQINSIYNDRLDVADMTRWVISRYSDLLVISGDVVQLVYRFGYMDIKNNSIMLQTFKIIANEDATIFLFGDDRSNPRVILQSTKSWEVSYFVREGIKVFHDMLLWRLQNFKVDQKIKRPPKEITAANFLKVIKDQDYKGTYSPWLILFYGNEDLESQMLREVYAIAGSELFPKVRVATINVAKELALTEYFFDMIFLPTVMYVGKRSHSDAYANPFLPMSQMPTVGHICDFALSERLLDMSAFDNNGVSAVTISVGDLPYNDARVFQFNSNTSIHLFSRL